MCVCVHVCAVMVRKKFYDCSCQSGITTTARVPESQSEKSLIAGFWWGTVRHSCLKKQESLCGGEGGVRV